MMAFSHIVIGATAWAVTAKVSGMTSSPAMIGMAALGALLPDIDHPGSWAGRRFRAVSVPLAALVGHRGVTHSLIATFLLAVGLYFYGTGAIIAPLLVGYASHLAADSLTPSGVPWLWPWKRTFSLNLFRTGSFAEYLLTACLAAVGGWAFGIERIRLPLVKSGIFF